MQVSVKTLASVFLRHWHQSDSKWALSDNAGPEVRHLVSTLPPKFTVDGVHAALDALSTGKPFPDTPASALVTWVGRPEALRYCQQAFLTKKPTPPTTFDEILVRARKAYESDLISHVHAFLAKQLNG